MPSARLAWGSWRTSGDGVGARLPEGASKDAVGRARAREGTLSPVRGPLRRGIRWQREERRAPARLREPSRLAPAGAEEREISARTEGSAPLLGEPRPHALLGLASALQVEDPAGVDRPL